jgi:hypothetical protein|tara:strand:+ start:313 stop:498 length:186 start_codon:yes stop_codon:yes gene_type:complete
VGYPPGWISDAFSTGFRSFELLLKFVIAKKRGGGAGAGLPQRFHAVGPERVPQSHASLGGG